MNRDRSTTAWWARSALVAAFALGTVAACSSDDVALTEGASDALTEQVVEIAQAAGAGDLESAGTSLDALEQRLDLAVAEDEVSADRAARIRLSLDAVRADLEALATATPTPDPAAVPEQTPAATPSEQPVVTPEVQPPADQGSTVVPSEKGKAKGKDKGKGKG